MTTIQLVAAVIAATVTSISLFVVVARYVFRRVLDAVDRIPPKEWFDNVTACLPPKLLIDQILQDIELGHTASSKLMDLDRRMSSVETGLNRGRERMDRTDEKLAQVVQDVTIIKITLGKDKKPE